MIRDYEDGDASELCIANQICYHRSESDVELLKVVESEKTWVAIDDDLLVGFIIGKIKHGIPYIYNVAVLPGARKEGFGKKLIEKFEEFFCASHVFWLKVDADNPAQKLYFDLGYRVESIDEHFYGRDKHALCMFKYS